MSAMAENTDRRSVLKEALRAVEEMQSKLEQAEHKHREPIAVIGLGCRFPGGANDPATFWRMLCDGVDAIQPAPAERWARGNDAHNGHGESTSTEPLAAGANGDDACWGGFLEPGLVQQFDATFFGIAPREAACMDPQHRLFLEVAWEAMERAGQPLERLTDSQTGVFAGIINNDNLRLQTDYIDIRDIDIYHITGNAPHAMGGRLAYLLGLRGPSMAVDTACSTSLVTVYLACQSLRIGDCRLAVAGGVNVILVPEMMIPMTRAGMLAPDGRCKTFDARADGFVRGEGCGVVVLKRLSDAQADGDPILAVIRGAAVNQDGRSSGLTVPNGLAQQELLRTALANAGVTPDQVGYIEAHGTGTSLGDPIEVEALGMVFRKKRAAENPLMLGSVKTNIGHLEGAAGIAGLIKAILVLQHQTIPPHLHLSEPSPQIEWGLCPMTIPTTLTPWPTGAQPRLAGVSSFGLSGTNAHILLEEAPLQPTASADAPGSAQPVVLPLSARSPAALQELAQRYRTFLADTTAPLHDVWATASRGRSHHDYRLALTGSSASELIDHLDAFLRSETRAGLAQGRKDTTRPLRIAFVCPGQGSQWLGMGRQLLRDEPVFRRTIEQCSASFEPYTDWSLHDYLTDDVYAARNERIDVIQPALFAISVALAELWRSWGIAPAAVIGHSMGEVAALHIAGALSLEDAARIICRRSQLLRRTSGQGAMAVVNLPVDAARTALAGHEQQLSIAVVNSPHSTVLSGDPQALAAVIERLQHENVFCRYIKVDVASHSPQMDALRADLLAALHGIAPRAGSIPIYSTVLGQVINGHACDATYWMQNLREPVRFADAVEQALADGHTLFIELSVHPILLAAVEQSIQAHDAAATTLPSLQREADERSQLYTTLGTLYCSGYPVNWDALVPAGSRALDLPTYPWQHQWFPIMPKTSSHRQRSSAAHRSGGASATHPLLERFLAAARPGGEQFWETSLQGVSAAYLTEYRVLESPMLPPALLAEMALAAGAVAFKQQPVRLNAMRFQPPPVIAPQTPPTLQLILTRADAACASFQIFCRPGGADATETAATLCAEGSIKHAMPIEVPGASTIATLQADCPQEIAGDAFYAQMQSAGWSLGASFQGLTRIWRGTEAALGQVACLEDRAHEQAAYVLPPTLFTACCQLLIASLPNMPAETTYLPAHVETLALFGRPAEASWCSARLHPVAQGGQDDQIVGDVSLLNASGEVVVSIGGLRLAPLDAGLRSHFTIQQASEMLYKTAWQLQERGAAATPAPTPVEPGYWLIFADSAGVGARLAALLGERGEQVVTVRPTPQEGGAAAGVMTIDPNAAQDFQQLVANTDQANARRLRGVVYLWALDAPPLESASGIVAAEQMAWLGSVPYLVRALTQIDLPADCRLWLITQGAQAVETTDARRLALPQVPLWGLGRVAALEHPELWGGLIDLAPDDADHAALLVDEIWQPDGEDQIAFRAGQRYLARLVPDRLPATAGATKLHADATYLITGGLGGLGLLVARSLVHWGARHLVLTGRGGLPPRAEWHTLAPESPKGQQVAAIGAMEAQGATVQVMRADVGSSAQMVAVLEAIQAGLPPLRGILHAAGVGHGQAVADITPDDFRSEFPAKVTGSWVLHHLTQPLALDFIVYFSSAAAVWGSRGLATYAAANSFMDGLASFQQAHGVPAISIAWGRWAQLQMAGAFADQVEHYFEQIGLEIMPTDQALALLQYLLTAPIAQVTVSAVNWHSFKPVYEARRRRMFLDQIAVELAHDAASGRSQSSFVAHLKQLAPEERRDALIEHVQAAVGQVLGVDPAHPVDPDQGFFQMGMDSVMSIELKRNLEHSLGCSVPTTAAFEHPTTAALATYIAAELLALDLDAHETPPAPSVAAPDQLSEIAEIEGLTDAEAEALLIAELEEFTPNLGNH